MVKIIVEVSPASRAPSDDNQRWYLRWYHADQRGYQRWFDLGQRLKPAQVAVWVVLDVKVKACFQLFKLRALQHWMGWQHNLD